MSERLYHTDDLVFPVPLGALDRTTHILEFPSETGESLALVIQRSLAAEADMDASFEAAKDAYPKKFAAYRLDEEGPGEANGIALRRLRFRWKLEAVALYHHQVFLQADATVFALTASGPASQREAVDTLLATVLSDMRFREP